MKKTLFIAGMMLATVGAQAQLKVNENGKVGINTGTANLVSDFCIGEGGNPLYRAVVRCKDSGLSVIRAGIPKYPGTFCQTIYAYNTPYANSYNIGVRALVHSSEELNSGRAYGFWGNAGNTTTGYNYGIFGSLTGAQNGAGVYGTTQSDNGININGRYAGYFNGDVKVTGTLYAPVLTTTAASSSMATAQIALAETSSTTTQTVSDKLAQLSAVQYNISSSLPLARTSQSASPASVARSISDTLSIAEVDTVELAYPSDIELQALEKNHYGLMAAQLQQVYPDLVYENQQGDLCINYIEMIPLLVESIKELKAEIATLQGGNNGGVVVMSRAIGSTTSVEEATALTIPMLKQNNPNPFTENTVIEYTLPETVQTANIYIYDMNGSQIEQIALTERGESSVTVNGGQLSAGMYLYSLIADGKVIDTKRMILTK